MASILSLEMGFLATELLVKLDLASALSFSFTSKFFYSLNASNSILGIHLRKSFINNTHPVKRVFLDMIREGYDSLLKEFIALRFRAALRSLSEGEFTEILAEALTYSRLDQFKVILALTKRRILFGRELMVALGSSGNISLINDLRERYFLADIKDIAPHLLQGAASHGKLNVIEWIKSELGGGPLGFLYSMLTKAAIGGIPFFFWI
jgi:hypothetical protein